MTVGSGLGRVPIGGAVLLACDLRRVGSVGHGIVGEWWYCTSGVEMPRDVEWRRGRRGSTAWQWGGKAAVCVNATGLLVEVSTKGLFSAVCRIIVIVEVGGCQLPPGPSHL